MSSDNEHPFARIEQPYTKHRRTRSLWLRVANGWGYLLLLFLVACGLGAASAMGTVAGTGCAGLVLLAGLLTVMLDVRLRIRALPWLRQAGWCVVDVRALLGAYPQLAAAPLGAHARLGDASRSGDPADSGVPARPSDSVGGGERLGVYRSPRVPPEGAMRGVVTPLGWSPKAGVHRDIFGARLGCRIVTHHGGTLICSDRVEAMLVMGRASVALIDTPYVEIWHPDWRVSEPRRIDVWAGDEVAVYGRMAVRKHDLADLGLPPNADVDEVLVFDGTEEEPVVVVPLGPVLAPAHGADLKHV